MQSPPTIYCDCKVKRCPRPDCMRCSKCGCDHDGLLVAEKLHRRRGKPRRTQPRRLEMPTPDDSLIEHELRPDATAASYLSPPPLTPVLGDHSRPAPLHLKLLRFVGVSEPKIDYYRKNVGAVQLRSSASLWDIRRNDLSAQEQKTRSVVVNAYEDMLENIAEIVCGTDGAQPSLAYFKRWLASDGSAFIRGEECGRSRSILPAARAMVVTKRGSVDRRIVRAVLCGSFRLKELLDVKHLVPGFAISKNTYTSGKDDFAILSDVGHIADETHSRVRYDPVVVDAAIDCILSRENVSYLSWGTKRISLDGATIAVPSIKRRRPINVMFETYRKSRDAAQAVSLRTFYRLCKVLTHGEVTARRAVDYVTGFLINDNFDLLSRIIARHLDDESALLDDKLQVLKDWLKYESFSEVQDSHSPTAARCPRHDISFSLLACRGGEREQREVACAPCLQMHQLLSFIRARLGESQAEPRTLSVVHDCFHKLDLFMGHRVRVVNQQRAIDKLFEEMKERCLLSCGSSEALVVIDFKMKMDPIYFREKTVDHYGKRGMSWHGVMVRFWSITDSQDEGACKAVETKVYFDHISANDNRQDKEAVLSLLEAMILSIRRDLPHISRIAVQSDNATCYQNALVTVLMPVLGAANGIQVFRFLHTETQDGKSVLDAHFARAMQKAVSWVKQGNNCATPTQLAVALAVDGGLPNSVAQLVEYDRLAVERLKTEASPVVVDFGKKVGRVNDVYYEYPAVVEGEQTSSELCTFRSSPSYRLRACAYSNIDQCIFLEVNPQSGKCILLGTPVTVSIATETALAPVWSGEDTFDCADDNCENDDAHTCDDVDCDVTIGDDDNEVNCLVDVDEEGFDSDEESDIDREIVFPNCSTGRMTQIKITTNAQIRRRERKWKAVSGATTFLPVSQTFSEDVRSKDIVAYAKRALEKLNNADNLGVISASTLSEQMMRLCRGLSQPQCLSPTPIAMCGWAIRPKRGQMYGAKYVNAYKDDVQKLFERGERSHGDKMSPAKMLEQLIAMYPDRFDLPSENDIRMEISKLFSLVKKRRRTVISVDSSHDQQANTIDAPQLPSPKRRRRMASNYSDFLVQMVTRNPSMKPRHAVESFRKEFAAASDVTDDQVRSKFSILKLKHKQETLNKPQYDGA